MSNHEFFRDLQDIRDRRDARRYKMETKSALDRELHRGHAKFQKAWESWRSGRKRLDALKDGSGPYELDWSKVRDTALMQIANLILCATVIKLGAWAATLFIAPMFLLINYLYLRAQQ